MRLWAARAGLCWGGVESDGRAGGEGGGAECMMVSWVKGWGWTWVLQLRLGGWERKVMGEEGLRSIILRTVSYMTVHCKRTSCCNVLVIPYVSADPASQRYGVR